MSRAGGIRAGGAFVELSTSDRLSAGLAKAQEKLNQFASALRNIGLVAAGAGAALAGTLFAATKSFADQGDALDEMSQRTGVSVEALSELQYGAKLAGVENETLETSLRFMSRALNEAAQGGKGAVDMLAQLGLRIEDLQGLTPDRQLELIADRLGGVQDQGQRAALSMELFGRSGTAMLPLLSSGAAGLQQMRARARELGLTFSSEGAASAASFSDAMDELQAVLRRAWQAVGEQLAPTLTQLIQILTNGAVAVLQWIKQNREVVLVAAGVAAGLVVVGGLVVALSIGMNILAGACALVSAAMSVLTAVTAALGVAQAVLVGGIAIVVVALGGLVVAAGAVLLYFNGTLGQMFDSASDTLGEIAATFRTMLGGIMDALQAGDVSLAAEILWAGLEVVWRQGIVKLEEMWKGFLAKTINTLLDWGKTVGQVIAVAMGNPAITLGIQRIAKSNTLQGFVNMARSLATALQNSGANVASLNRLKDAQDKLNAARERASTLAAEEEKRRNSARKPGAPKPLDLPELPSIQKPELLKLEIDMQSMERLQSLGTFSGDFAAQLTAGSDSAVKQTADATARTAALTAKIERLLQQGLAGGPLVFA